jgi:hypothetical protein
VACPGEGYIPEMVETESSKGSERDSRWSYGPDVFTEPDADTTTLENLGPLTKLAGVWRSEVGHDEHPVAEGLETDAFVERYELQPIDPQTNGPQLFYGLRYHAHIAKPGEIETFHDQVGYWLWEPAVELVTFTLAIPRGQVLLASGRASADATEFEIHAELGDGIYGILSNPFLDQNYKTTSFTMRVSTGPGDSWSYEEETILEIPGFASPFNHVDRNTLARIAPPSPNPLAGGPTLLT